MPTRPKPNMCHYVLTLLLLWLCKQCLNGCFQMKELERTDEPIARMNVECKLEKAAQHTSTCQHVAKLQFDSCAEKD